MVKRERAVSIGKEREASIGEERERSLVKKERGVSIGKEREREVSFVKEGEDRSTISIACSACVKRRALREEESIGERERVCVWFETR